MSIFSFFLLFLILLHHRHKGRQEDQQPFVNDSALDLAVPLVAEDVDEVMLHLAYLGAMGVHDGD